MWVDGWAARSRASVGRRAAESRARVCEIWRPAAAGEAPAPPTASGRRASQPPRALVPPCPCSASQVLTLSYFHTPYHLLVSLWTRPHNATLYASVIDITKLAPLKSLQKNKVIQRYECCQALRAPFRSLKRCYAPIFIQCSYSNHL